MIRRRRLSPKQKYSLEEGEQCCFHTTYISSLEDLIPAQSRYGSVTRPFPREWIPPQKVKGLTQVTGRGLRITSHCLHGRKIIPMCTTLHESLSDLFSDALNIWVYDFKRAANHIVIVFRRPDSVSFFRWYLFNWAQPIELVPSLDTNTSTT
jgi:hypothetical protein